MGVCVGDGECDSKESARASGLVFEYTLAHMYHVSLSLPYPQYMTQELVQKLKLLESTYLRRILDQMNNYFI